MLNAMKTSTISSQLSKLGPLRRASRNGWLPQKFQGGVRTLSPRRSVAMRGLVLGVPRLEWERVAAAFPEWDLAFARRTADVDEIIREIRADRRTLIVGEMANRKVLDVKQAVPGVGTWHLSRAPLPVIDGALGYLLEAGASWRGARRETEMERLAASRALETLPQLWQSLTTIRNVLSPQTNASGPRLIIAPDGRRLGSAVMKATPLVPAPGDVVFSDHLERPWWHDDVQKALDAALSNCSKIVSDGHPVAARPILLGTPHETLGRAFWNSAPSSEINDDDRPSHAMAHFAAMLTLARYVKDDHQLFDPLSLVG